MLMWAVVSVQPFGSRARKVHTSNARAGRPGHSSPGNLIRVSVMLPFRGKKCLPGRARARARARLFVLDCPALAVAREELGWKRGRTRLPGRGDGQGFLPRFRLRARARENWRFDPKKTPVIDIENLCQSAVARLSRAVMLKLQSLLSSAIQGVKQVQTPNARSRKPEATAAISSLARQLDAEGGRKFALGSLD